MEDPTRIPEHFFRHEAGRWTARLTRRFGAAHLPLVEDAVQTALQRAVTSFQGTTPEALSAWLGAVAKNLVLDELRKRKREELRDEPLGVSSEASAPPILRGEIADDELRLLFVCADGHLSEQAQLVLALKLLCGLSTREIAIRLFLEEANVQKLLERGRSRLAEVWAASESDDYLSPTSADVLERRNHVLRMLHVLFTAGHAPDAGPSLLRRELSEEALRLAQHLAAHPTGNHTDTWALLAIFHLHLARFPARSLDGKTLVMLDEQDRSAWDRHHLELGYHCLLQAGHGQRASTYHFEAAILAEHCFAPSYEQTQWGEIVSLYEHWEKLAPSPLLTLNRAIALAEWKGPEAALALLRELTPPAWLARYYLWDATLSELSRRAGDFPAAIALGEAAMARAPTEAERAIFRARVERARAGDRDR